MTCENDTPVNGCSSLIRHAHLGETEKDIRIQRKMCLEYACVRYARTGHFPKSFKSVYAMVYPDFWSKARDRSSTLIKSGGEGGCRGSDKKEAQKGGDWVMTPLYPLDPLLQSNVIA